MKLAIFGYNLITILLLLGCNNSSNKESPLKKDEQATASTIAYKKITNANFITMSELNFQNGNNKANHYYSIFVENFDEHNGNFWDDIENEAKTKPYITGGMTIVFFFNNKKYTPQINKNLDFGDKYAKYCIAGYWHYPTGIESFQVYPFK